MASNQFTSFDLHMFFYHSVCIWYRLFRKQLFKVQYLTKPHFFLETSNSGHKLFVFRFEYLCTSLRYYWQIVKLREDIWICLVEASNLLSKSNFPPVHFMLCGGPYQPTGHWHVQIILGPSTMHMMHDMFPSCNFLLYHITSKA